MAGCMLFVFSACQESPENPIVVNKKLDNLADTAVGETDKNSGSGHSDTISRQLGVPDTLTMKLANGPANVKIHTGAPVIVPDTVSMPTARVGMDKFSEDDVKNLFYALCGDTKVIPNDAPSTQANYMRDIQGLMRQKEDGILDKYESIAEMDAAIEKMKSEMAQAPESSEQIEPDFSFNSIVWGASDSRSKTKTGEEEVVLRTSKNDGIVSDLSVYNAEDGIGASRAEYYRDLFYTAELSEISEILVDGYIKHGISVEVEPAVDGETALQTANQVIASLGLSDFVCSGSRLYPLYEANSSAEEPLTVMHEFM
jgi:hypothetical protein